nr:hypothetical protein [uncultured Carboxylicivirga sp.]
MRKIIIAAIVIFLIVFNPAVIDAQNFNNELTNNEKEVLVKRMTDFVMANIGQVSGFYIGKSNDGILFSNICSVTPMNFENGRMVLNKRRALNPNGEVSFAYNRYTTSKKIFIWANSKLKYDSEGRVKSAEKIIERRTSLNKDAKLLFAYKIAATEISYPDNKTMIISNTIYREKTKKKDKEIVERSSVVKIEADINTITITDTKNFHYGKGSSTVTKYIVLLDDTGKSVKNEFFEDNTLSEILTCEYDEMEWLSKYQLKRYKSTGEFNEKRDCEIVYRLKDDGLDESKSSSYIVTNNAQWYDEEGQLFREEKDRKVRMRQEDGSMGPWKQLRY